MRDHGDELVLDAAGPLRLGASGALGHQQPLPIGLRPLTRGRVAALRPDVPEHQDDAEEVPTGITNRRGAVGNLQFPSIAGHEHGLTHRRGVLAGAQNDVRRVQRRLARPLIEDAVDDLERLSDGGLRRPTGQRLRRRVEVGHHAARIRGDHRVGDAVQRDAEPGLLGRQRRGGALALGDVPRDLRRTDDPAVSSRTAETVSETSMRRPSFRTRTVSK